MGKINVNQQWSQKLILIITNGVYTLYITLQIFNYSGWVMEGYCSQTISLYLENNKSVMITKIIIINGVYTLYVLQI